MCLLKLWITCPLNFNFFPVLCTYAFYFGLGLSLSYTTDSHNVICIMTRSISLSHSALDYYRVPLFVSSLVSFLHAKVHGKGISMDWNLAFHICWIIHRGYLSPGPSTPQHDFFQHNTAKALSFLRVEAVNLSCLKMLPIRSCSAALPIE